MRQTFTLMLTTLLLASVVGCSTFGKTQDRIVTTTGTAVTKVAPDMVVWHLTVSDMNKDLKQAKASTDQKLKIILALARELGAEPKDVQTGYLSVEKQYDRDGRGNPVNFRAFYVVRSVTIKQRDINRFEEFFNNLASKTEFEATFEFESSRFTELRSQTRLDALKVAREKAEAMTKVLGARLGGVLAIEEEGTPRPMSYSASPYGNSYFANNASNAITEVRDSSAADISEGTFAPGSIEIRVSVSTKFAIN